MAILKSCNFCIDFKGFVYSDTTYCLICLMKVKIVGIRYAINIVIVNQSPIS
jgi:hypothetical protein